MWTVSNRRCKRHTPRGAHWATRENMVFWQCADVLKQTKKLKELLAGGKQNQRERRLKERIPPAPSSMRSRAATVEHDSTFLRSYRQHGLKFWLMLFLLCNATFEWSSSVATESQRITEWMQNEEGRGPGSGWTALSHSYRRIITDCSYCQQTSKDEMCSVILFFPPLYYWSVAMERRSGCMQDLQNLTHPDWSLKLVFIHVAKHFQTNGCRYSCSSRVRCGDPTMSQLFEAKSKRTNVSWLWE